MLPGTAPAAAPDLTDWHPQPSPLLAREGAVEGSGPDAGVPLHLGRPVHEQRALEAGDAVVDLSQLGVVTVSGADRLTWLDTLSSQWVRDLTPGQAAELLLLDNQGHIAFAAAVVDDAETTWLVVEGACAAPLAAFLDSMRFMLDVEVRVRADVAVLGALGGGRDRLRAADPLAVWDDPWPVTAPGSTAYGPADADHPGADHPVVLALLARDRLEEAVAAALAPADARSVGSLAGTWAWEAVRVAAYRPRHGREVDDRTLPHELDWLRTGVHLTKGCYRGQETVAKLVNLGRPPRRLVLLHLDGSEHITPEAGAPVENDGKVVGRLTSVVRHGTDGPLALAVVKRSVPTDAVLTTGGVTAAQEVVVDPSGVTDARPGERPGAGLRRLR
ncbi:YgfZ/GcvT domain-containing protein [Georgenia sp. Z1344]|uniref:CAF17-like 4Fe-4S cluster assembly/insertion protein YgfZ n=1 Tax=Georgenia sp. Z1344 TaxID=3416706 RepID=UPI003CF563A6